MTTVPKIEDKELNVSKRLQAVLNTVVDGILTINHKGEIQEFNRSAEKIFGYGANEVIGKNIKMLMPDPYHSNHDNYISNYLTTGDAKIIGIGREVTAKRKDNTTFPMELGVSQVSIGDERLFVGIIRDISERKKTEEALKEANEKLKNTNKELETFTYIVSHDLKTPLVNLKGFASELQTAADELMPVVKKLLVNISEDERIKTTTLLEKNIPKAIRFINNSVEKIDTLAGAILELSRIGHRQMALQHIRSRELVEELINTLRFIIDSRKIKVTIGDLPDIAADYVSMQQVFGNILDNAIKYLDPKRAGEIHIEGIKRELDTLFSIRDNGRGISEYNLPKVFEIFRRLDNSTDIPGEGMGMAYVKSLLERHEGKVWCESTIGKGTTFFFTISDNIKTEEING